MMLVFLGIFAIIASFIFSPSVLRILANNRNKRMQSARYSEQAIIPDELDFPLATIASSKSIREVRDILVREATHISPFLVIETISECDNNCFLITGNFTGTRLTAQKRGFGISIRETSMERLYEGNIVVQQNEDESFTLRSMFPEDKNHDLYIRDFIGRLKALIS